MQGEELDLELGGAWTIFERVLIGIAASVVAMAISALFVEDQLDGLYLLWGAGGVFGMAFAATRGAAIVGGPADADDWMIEYLIVPFVCLSCLLTGWLAPTGLSMGLGYLAVRLLQGARSRARTEPERSDIPRF